MTEEAAKKESEIVPLPPLSFTSSKQTSNKATTGDQWLGGNTFNYGLSDQNKTYLIIGFVAVVGLWFWKK